MLAEKPPKLVAVALANRMARITWALSVREEAYRAPAAAGVVTKQLPGKEQAAWKGNGTPGSVDMRLRA